MKKILLALLFCCITSVALAQEYIPTTMSCGQTAEKYLNDGTILFGATAPNQNGVFEDRLYIVELKLDKFVLLAIIKKFKEQKTTCILAVGISNIGGKT
jgi:hypothetical protein